MSIVISDSMRSHHSSIDPYGNLRITEKTSVIDLKSVFGVCHYRDVYTEEGAATVTLADAQFELRVTGGADRAALTSCERGTYVAGFSSECGMGLRADPTQFDGDQTLDFGYFDEDDGYFFRLTRGALSLHVRKGGVTTDIPRALWNGDHGPHATVDMARGVVFVISFTYYGFGSILFSIAQSDLKGAQINRMLHSYAAPSGITCENPNLPINVRLDSNGSAGDIAVHVGGRQFSVQGIFDPKFRVTQTEEGMTATDSWTPLVSYGKNAGHRMCAMKMYQCDVLTTGALMLHVRIDAELVGATYTAQVEPADCIPGVSGLTRDVAATSASGGLLLYGRLVPAGHTSFEFPSSVNIDQRAVTVMCRTLQGTAQVNAVVRIKEYF